MHKALCVIGLSIILGLSPAASAAHEVEVELENLSGEDKTDWPVVLTVYQVFGRNLPKGLLDPDGYRVLDAKGAELACTVEKRPPYDQPGNDELIFVIPSMKAGASATYRVTNNKGRSGGVRKLDILNNPNNLLKNPGFEATEDGKIAGWSGPLSRDTKVKRSGKASMRLRGTRRQIASHVAEIPVHKGSYYYFGGWAKTDNVSRHALYKSRGVYFDLPGFDNLYSGKDRTEKRTERRKRASIWRTCATRDWFKMRFRMSGRTHWGLPEPFARAAADKTTLKAVLDQRRMFYRPKDKQEGTVWIDDLMLFEQPKVTVRFDKLLAPHIKAGVFLFTRPTNSPLGRLREKYGPWTAWPFPWEKLERLDRYGLKGQRVSYFFGMLLSKPRKQAHVRVKGGRFDGPGGGLPVTEIEYAPGFIGPNPSKHLRPHAAAADLPDGKCMPYFVVSVEVPRDAAPGSYTGTVELTLDGKLMQSVPLKLRVQDLKLPVLRDTYIGMIFQGGSIPFNDAGLKQYSKSGFSSVTRFGGFLRYKKDKDGEWHVDLDHLDERMKWLRSYGITAGVCPFSDFDLGCQWNGGRLYKKVQGKKEKYQREVKRIEAAQKAHPDWPRMIYMTWDEPIPGQKWVPNTRSKVHGGPCEMMNWVPEVAPDAPHTLDAHYFVFDKILKYYNMPAFDDPANFCGPDMYSFMKGLGKDYGFAAAQGRGETARYQPGMMMLASGARYMHVWHLAGGNKLMTVVDGRVLRSPAMVAAGEGMDDFKVHRLLTDLIKKCRAGADGDKKKTAAEAEAYLRKIHSVWDADHAYASGLPYLGYASNWGYEQFYDDWQRKMARYAARLKGVEWIQ
jgi:hypothetical protein